jgi:CBS domain-containing protein
MIAGEIMTCNVVTVVPETSAQEVAALLSRQRISGAPVVAADGKILGIVTEADIITKVNREGLRAADIMCQQIVSVQESTPVHEVAKLLAERRIKRVPVIRNGKLVGIVSRADIVEAIAHGYIMVRDW